MFYRILPDKTLTFKGENCSGGKLSKEKLTVLLCCNETGTEMLRPLVIGRAKNPRCFKNVRTFLCTYHANSNSWMTMAIFESFLRMLDAKMRSIKRKILLFIDQCPAHPSDTSYLSNVKPLDQGIIRCVKQCYRKRLVYDRLASLEAPKKISVLDAMNFLNSTWNSIDANTVINCFNKSGFYRKLSDSSVVENTDESVTISKEWQQIAGTNVTFSDYSSIRRMPIRKDNADDDDDDKEQEVLPIPTLTAALEAMDTVRRYVCSFNVDENYNRQKHWQTCKTVTTELQMTAAEPILPDPDVSEPDTVSEDELDHTFQQSHSSSDDEVIDEDDASASARRKSYIWRRRPFNPETAAFIESDEEIPPVLRPIEYFHKHRKATQCLYSNLAATEAEIEVLIGMLLTMGVSEMARYRMYWANQTRMDTVANCMSRNRFETLLRFLHFNDNDKVVMDQSHPEYDRFYKIQPLIENIRKTCLEETPGELQSVDEHIIPYKGRCRMKYYNPRKPDKWGFESVCEMREKWIRP
ncbi:Tigger transposable element-derived protein 4 [Trichinella papuae]|uniref:Tigger transposable element-derived protein 4 n=1 Tax=Trichinella papuae TaxID=268474 RepID=A0A0V1N056_9BILA|nr:Tigger transposable element-derived protein 4 [Trichinella papuae]